ncbi:MAG: outer membrane beta-barrel protein [Cyclobacteriaceae bacterium]|nr:outer membrane beta-barrel protein [Cyclobacteriaceae bacterium]
MGAFEIRLVAAFFLLFSTFFVSAQTWTQKLLIAERDYDAGRLVNIVDNISGGFEKSLGEKGYTREEKIRALKLITKVYIFMDNESKSDEYMIKLLRADKEHDLDPKVDPAELYDLYRKFRSQPIFRIGLRVGVNKSYPNIINTFGTGNTGIVSKIYNGVGESPNEASVNGGSGTGFFINAMAERYLDWGLEVGLGLEFRNSQYSVDNYITYGDSLQVNGISEIAQFAVLSTMVTHQQSFFRVPLLLRYNFKYDSDNSFVPYIAAGASYDYLLDAKYLEGNRTGGTEYKFDSDLSLKDLDLIAKNNFSVFACLGLKMRIKTHFLTLEAKFNKALLNYINPNNRWSNNPLSTYDLAFVEDDFSLDILSFSFGYTYSIYNPQKLKEFK